MEINILFQGQYQAVFVFVFQTNHKSSLIKMSALKKILRARLIQFRTCKKQNQCHQSDFIQFLFYAFVAPDLFKVGFHDIAKHKQILASDFFFIVLFLYLFLSYLPLFFASLLFTYFDVFLLVFLLSFRRLLELSIHNQDYHPRHHAGNDLNNR